MRRPSRLQDHPGAVMVLAVGCAIAPACVRDLEVLAPPGVADAGSMNAAPLVLYRFDEGAGALIRDTAGGREPVDLTVGDMTRTTWLPDGLRLDAPVRIEAAAPPAAFIEEVRRTGEITVEAWVTPSRLQQDGTQRVVTLSTGPDERNFTLGIGGLFSEDPRDVWTHRLRTTETNKNGLPPLTTVDGSARSLLTHVVAVRTSDGRHTLWIDGTKAAERALGGTMEGWRNDERLALGDEWEGEGNDPRVRAFIGTFHLVGLYAVGLTDDEVRDHFQRGHRWPREALKR